MPSITPLANRSINCSIKNSPQPSRSSSALSSRRILPQPGIGISISSSSLVLPPHHVSIFMSHHHHAPPRSNYHRARASSMDMTMGQPATTAAAGATWGQPYYPHPPTNNYQLSHHQHRRHRHHHESAPLVFQSAHHQQQQQQQSVHAHHHHFQHSYPHQHQYSYQHPANYGYPPPPPPHQFFCHGQQHQYHHVTPHQHQQLQQQQQQSHHNARQTLEHQAQPHPASSAVATAASTRPVLHRPNSGIQQIISSSPKQMISSETNDNVMPSNETPSSIDFNDNEGNVNDDDEVEAKEETEENVAQKRVQNEENEHEMMILETVESIEQEKKLAAVDAIFAAAEVIAKRTTSPTSTATSISPSNDYVSSDCKSGRSSGSTIFDDNTDTITTSSEVPPQMPSSSSSTSLDAIVTVNQNAIDAATSSSIKNANDNVNEVQSSPTCTKKPVITTPKPQRPMKKRKIVVVETNTPQSNQEKKEKESRSSCAISMKKPFPHPTLSLSSSSTKTSPQQQRQQLGLPQTPKLVGAVLFDNDQLLSSRALVLSQTIEEEPALYREILLHMALERETPRKPGGGAPDHHRRTKASDSSTASSGSSTSASVSSSSDEDGNASSSSSTSSSSLTSGGSQPQISIGKRRGNQYVEGISVHTMMGGGDGVSGPNIKIITNGFFWKDVPELESILQRYMEEYYEMSENCPQSKNQQQFNNRLVGIIYSTALQCGYTFDPESFGCSDGGEAGSINSSAPSTPTEETIGNPDCEAPQDAASTSSSSSFNYKKLRDRIRCYYKTHVQNSKKRLITLLKNPSRPKNREVLIKIVEEVKDRANSSRGGGSGGVVGRRQLSTNGIAALRRLEEKERSILLCPNNSTSCLVTPSLGMTTPSARNSSGTLRDRYGGNGSIGVVPSSMCRSASSNCSSGVSSSISSSSGGSEKCEHESPPEWPAPPLTRRVPMDSMDAGHYDRCVSNTKVPQFASPCKPEHVAILTSIRQVPSRVLYTSPETLSSSA